MALGDLYQNDVDQALSIMAALPPEPAKKPERGMWATAADSVKGQAAKMMASALEVGNVIGPALSLAADPTNDQALEAVKQPLDFKQTDDSKRFRDFEVSLRPDPATAGKAEQIVYGAVGPMVGLVGAALTGGVPGLLGASAESGFSASEELRQKGVDLATRSGVGAIQAGVTAGTALLPMAGSTLKATAGLYLAGGPLSFMAQQQATRSILERADYGELAQQYDPLDPTGLALSALIPLPFAGYGAYRNIRAPAAKPAPAGGTGAPRADQAPAGADVAPEPVVAPTAPREQIDAAMVQNLTLQSDAASFERPRPDLKPAVTLDQTWLSAKVDGGEVSGRIQDDGLHIKFAELDPGKRGEGVGVALYQALVDDAHARGLRVFSDITVESPAVRVYQALGRRGYEVERLPGGGELPISPESPDGALFGRGANSPVFEVKPRASEAAPAGPDLPRIAQAPAGRTAEVVTERGLVAPVRYRLVEAGDLITSHGDDLAANPAFPAELQPRDRTRAASAEQIARIENGLRPELLGDSAKASDGAPIIGPDGVVESGNARTIALRRAYGSDKADAYRAWLAKNAEGFGLTADQVAGLKNPVLVRERLGQVDRAEFARQANEANIAAMSPAEQAKADAARLTDLSGLETGDDGTINLARSAPFVRQFMQQAVSPADRAAMMTADGRLSQAGQTRLRNAIFSKAYNDTELVSMMAEATDGNVRNVIAGLLRAAPDVARLQDLVAAGARPPVNVAAELVKAVRQFSKLRADGTTVNQYLTQGDLLGGSPSPELNNLLLGISENARSAKRIGEMVRALVDAVDSLGDPRQAGLLDDAMPSTADLSANAVERMRSITDAQLTDTAPASSSSTKLDPLMQSVADRVAEAEATMGDLVVRAGDDGRPVTLAEEMAAVRRDAAEGSDLELGALDAELVKVAADCALSSGAV